MKLTRIDAIRFGALENACLDGIGDGLTVVLGPNESGKSTYTALVRAVLFGFPGGRGKAGDRFYRPAAGNRAARLTFADESGEWAVDRVDGTHGGPVSVAALRGPERPGLLADLLGEMKEQTYRVVFGFGLDELDDIDNGEDPHLAARLYAAGSGLEVNPLDVRAALEKEAGDLFKPGGRVSTLNRLAQEMKDVRAEIRALEAAAAEFAADQERADRLAGELEPLRVRRDELDARLRDLTRDAQRADSLAADAAALAERIERLGDDEAAVRASLEAAVPDERVLAVAAELDALLEEYSAYRQRLESARTFADAAAAGADRVAALGELPAGVADSAEARARVDAWATRRAQIEGEIRVAERRAATAEALAREHPAGGPAVSAARPSVLPAWGAAAAGVVFALAGAVLGQWLAIAFGALVALAGVAMALSGGTLVPAGAAGDAAAEVARASADARAARADAEAAREALRTGEAAWAAYLDTAGLRSRGDDPVAVRSLLDALRERADIVAEAGRQAAAAAREAEAADAWAQRFAGLAAGFLGIDGTQSVDDVPGAVARAREAIAAARLAAERRARALESLAGIEPELARVRERRDERVREIGMLAETYGVGADGLAAALEALAERTADELAEARGATDGRADELAALRGRLDAGGRDAAMAVARQRLEGLRVRASAAAERYVATALAVRLLDRARERYERERQPEVTRVAGAVFSEMTGGRYSGIRVPLDGSGIAVVSPSGGLRPVAELSTGTAQQLYLAMRVGFLASLEAGRSLPVLMDDVVVNFDAERRAGAAAAIAELARTRQVVFFTCHPETADALTSALPGSALVSLDRCELRG